MGYLRAILADDEKILRRARFNWTYNVVSLFWLALGAAPIGYRIATGGLPTSRAAAGALMALLAIGAVVMVARFLVKWTTVIAVTTERLVYKSGVVARRGRDIAVDKVEEVNLQQSFLGRLCNYGVVKVGGEGVGMLALPPIDDPVGFVRSLEEASAARAPQDGSKVPPSNKGAQGADAAAARSLRGAP